MAGGEKLKITLTTRMLGHVLRINTQRISIHIYLSQLRHRVCMYSSDNALIF